MLCPESALVLHKLGFHSRCSDGNQGHPRTRQKTDDTAVLALTHILSSSNNILKASEASFSSAVYIQSPNILPWYNIWLH